MRLCVEGSLVKDIFCEMVCQSALRRFLCVWMPFDEQRVFDSDSIAKLAFLPKRVVISGVVDVGR